MGAISSCFNKVSFLSLYKKNNKCTKCDICVDVCPTRVQSMADSDRTGKVGDTGCIYCLKCVKACPEKALALRFTNKEIYNGESQWLRRT